MYFLQPSADKTVKQYWGTMQYKIIGKIESGHSFILWGKSALWFKMILSLLENNANNPLIGREFLNFIKAENIEDTEKYLQELSCFILVFLYLEIPFQMGLREISQTNKYNQKILEKEKKAFNACMENAKDIVKGWEKLVKMGVIFDVDKSLLKFIPELLSLMSSMQGITGSLIYKGGGLFIEQDIKKVNPFFGKKQNIPTVLRDFVMKYLSFLIHILKIDFQTAYQKHKCIYQILSRLFAHAEYPEFHLMENLRQEDLKNYLNCYVP